MNFLSYMSTTPEIFRDLQILRSESNSKDENEEEPSKLGLFALPSERAALEKERNYIHDTILQKYSFVNEILKNPENVYQLYKLLWRSASNPCER